MKHLDLFSGIGGFALAVDRVWHEEKNEHIFVEWDDFCTEVLKKHWKDAEYHKDIRTFVADSHEFRRIHGQSKIESTERNDKALGQLISSSESPFLLTGGFPCQPFSQAGRRKGTDDDRYLWPPMLECISLFRPKWVIAENVSGIATWNEGLVFETVCADLEKEGYEVQPFRIPACAVQAPHRRDRWWFVANANDQRRDNGFNNRQERYVQADERITSQGESERQGRERRARETDTNAQDSERKRGSGKMEGDGQVLERGESEAKDALPSWEENWIEVATRLCRVDDGVPRRMDRNPRLKALGNAIVPQVAEEIIKQIRILDESIAIPL